MSAGGAAENGVRVRSTGAPRLRALGVAGLLVVGLALLGLGAASWLDRSAPGPTRTATTSVTSAIKSGSSATRKVESTVTTTPGKPNLHSEAVPVTLFVLGALLFLCAIFFGRVVGVTLPGGAGLTLNPEAQVKLVQKVASQAQAAGLSPEPETLGKLYEASLAQLGAPGAGGGEAGVAYAEAAPGARRGAGASRSAELSDEQLDAAVSAAIGQLSPPDQETGQPVGT